MKFDYCMKADELISLVLESILLTKLSFKIEYSGSLVDVFITYLVETFIYFLFIIVILIKIQEISYLHDKCTICHLESRSLVLC